jgi:hypothetical protein
MVLPRAHLPHPPLRTPLVAAAADEAAGKVEAEASVESVALHEEQVAELEKISAGYIYRDHIHRHLQHHRGVQEAGLWVHPLIFWEAVMKVVAVGQREELIPE